MQSGMSTDEGTGVIQQSAKAISDTGLKGVRHARGNRDESGHTTVGNKNADWKQKVRGREEQLRKDEVNSKDTNTVQT